MAAASSDGSFMAWIRRSTDSLCDRAADNESIHGKAQLLAELQGWRTYLEEIVEKLGLWSTPSEQLCRRQSETLLELRGRVERLRLAEEKTGGCRTVVELSVDQIVKDITAAGEEAQQIATDDDGVDVEEDQQPGFQLPADPSSMPVVVRNDAAVAAAVGGRVTPFHMETFHLKSMVADMSGLPMAKLKVQAETDDEVLLVWEPEQPPPSPSPPASSRIRANFLSARLKGHDANHGGRVDYQFFSPPIDFDTEEESPLQPGRHTAAAGASLHPSANVLSITVTNSDSGGFPLSLYGSVVVRDALDRHEGIRLFHRERDDPQLITSQGQPLLLTGPTRGLVVFGFLFFDFDLKLRTGRAEEDDDVEFMREMMEYNSHMNQHAHISDTLSSPLGAVELRYAAVRSAIECTVEVQILESTTTKDGGNQKMDLPVAVVVDRQHTKISARAHARARTTKVPEEEEMVLFDSNATGAAITVGDDGVLVVAVSAADSLVITVETWEDDGDGGDMHTKSSFAFTPLLYGEGRAVVPYAGYTMQIKVVWSALVGPHD